MRRYTIPILLATSLLMAGCGDTTTQSTDSSINEEAQTLKEALTTDIGDDYFGRITLPGTWEKTPDAEEDMLNTAFYKNEKDSSLTITRYADGSDDWALFEDMDSFYDKEQVEHWKNGADYSYEYNTLQNYGKEGYLLSAAWEVVSTAKENATTYHVVEHVLFVKDEFLTMIALENDLDKEDILTFVKPLIDSYSAPTISSNRNPKLFLGEDEQKRFVDTQTKKAYQVTVPKGYRVSTFAEDGSMLQIDNLDNNVLLTNECYSLNAEAFYKEGIIPEPYTYENEEDSITHTTQYEILGELTIANRLFDVIEETNTDTGKETNETKGYFLYPKEEGTFQMLVFGEESKTTYTIEQIKEVLSSLHIKEEGM